MIYLVSNNNSVKNNFKEKVLKPDSYQIIDEDYFSLNDVSHAHDILILDIDDFNSVDSLMEYYISLPKLLNVIGIIDKPHLSHGALLIKKGFKSYLGKDTDKEVFKLAIESVLNGNAWLYPQLMNFIIKHISIETDEYTSSEILDKLSDKEKSVALLVADGFSNKEIAQSLDVQLVTIKKHISHIFSKLEIKDRLSLALLINQ